MWLNDYPKCHRCGGPCKKQSDRKARPDGRFTCCECWKDPASMKYRSHWMVLSLQYKKSGLPGIKRRKPLPGQMEMFTDQEGFYE